MREIKSPSTFKTSYIAEVKEEMGLLTRKKGKKRKVKTPQHIKPFIKQAIENIGFGATYAKIQQEALKLYREHLSKEIEDFYGIFKVKDPSLIREIAENKEIAYGVEGDQEVY